MNEIEEQIAFGKRLAALRKKHGYTQAELGEKIGVSRALIANYERGIVRISASSFVKIAKVLNISADKMFGLEPMPESKPIEKLKYMKRLKYMDQLPIENQGTLLALIDNYLRQHGIDIPKVERTSGEKDEEEVDK